MSSSSDRRPDLNLEQQRKRAKELRRAHHDGSLEAAERIGRHLPRARGQSSAQLLASTFTLSDAQLVVAREAGFPSWPSLRREIELSRAGSDARLEALLDAAIAGDVDVGTDDPSRRSLHLAAALGDAPGVLVALNAAPARATERGGLRQWTPLFYCCSARHGRGDPAVVAGRVRIAARLLELGADPGETIESYEGSRSVLAGAAREVASAELMEVLIRGGARLEPKGSSPVFPLQEAVIGGDAACVQRLLAARPPSWQTREALEVAILHDRPDLVRLLLAYGAEPSKAGRWKGHLGSCLHAAIMLRRERAMLEVLLDSDVDLSARDRDGRTAYAVAVRTGHDEAATLLRQRGASEAELGDVDRVIAACVRLDADEAHRLADAGTKRRYRYTDHLMLSWAMANQPAALPLLLEAGLDPNVADPDGETPLHRAVASGDEGAISALRAAGASPEVRDFRGRTPFGAPVPADEQRERDELFERAADAVAFGDLETLRGLLDEQPELVHWRSPREHRATLLLYCGANGTESPRQRTPANAAAVAQLLLDRGSEVDAAGRFYGGGVGATTLAMVLTSGFTMEGDVGAELVRVLVRAGARLDLWGDPRTPVLWALDWGAYQSFLALVEAGPPPDDLLFAAAANRLDLLDRMLARGEDVNRRFQRAYTGNFTALHAAAIMGHEEAVTFLLARGADATVRDASWGGTPAAKARWRHHLEVARILEDRERAT
jgi:ankyrin repeat protein